MPISPDPAAGSGSPTAQLLAFPPQAVHCNAFAARIERTMSEDWRERFCPLLSVVVELLELSDDGLVDRLSLMGGTEGTALVGDLLTEVDAATGEMRLFLSGLAVLNTRVKRGMKSAGLVLPA